MVFCIKLFIYLNKLRETDRNIMWHDTYAFYLKKIVQYFKLVSFGFICW